MEKVYVSYASYEVLSKVISFDDIQEIIPISFVKKTKTLYYTFLPFDTGGAVYFFFEEGGRCVGMVRLCGSLDEETFLDQISVGTTTLNNVQFLDSNCYLEEVVPYVLNPAMPSEDRLYSEHAFQSGTIIQIQYENDGESYVVSEITVFEKSAEKLISEIDGNDLP